MGPSSDQIEQQIVEVRGSMESKIVELRERSRRQVRRISRTALIALGTGAAVGVVVLGVFVAYRVIRAPTTGERFRRLLPAALVGADPRRAGSRARRRFRERVPPMRLYVGDRQVGEEQPVTRWEKIAVRAAQAGGTALAGALVSRLMSALTEAARSRRQP